MRGNDYFFGVFVNTYQIEIVRITLLIFLIFILKIFLHSKRLIVMEQSLQMIQLSSLTIQMTRKYWKLYDELQILNLHRMIVQISIIHLNRIFYKSEGNSLLYLNARFMIQTGKQLKVQSRRQIQQIFQIYQVGYILLYVR